MGTDNGGGGVWFEQRLLESAGDDREFARELIDDYLSSSKQIVIDLASALASETTQTIALLAHSLKGASRTIGADAVADACLRLEIAGKQDDARLASDYFSGVQHELARLTPILLAYLQVMAP